MNNAKENFGIPYMSKYVSKNGPRYRYQRRVPIEIQATLNRKIWDLSLGSHYGKAVDKARLLASEHDAQIAQLSTPEGRAQHQNDAQDRVAATVLKTRPGMRVQVNDKGEFEDVPPMDKNPGHWKKTPEKLKYARTLSPKQELQELGAHAAFAFGDRTTYDQVGGTAYHDALVGVMQPERPTDPTDAALFDMYKVLLDKRVTEIGGAISINEKHTLTYLHGVIARLRKSSPNTIRNHKVTTARFLRFCRDDKGWGQEPPLTAITDDLLQEYLEHLMNDPEMGDGSIHKYFDGMKSVFNHAIKRKKVPGLVVNPVNFLELPKKDSVEETMFLPFDRDEMKRIWEQAHIIWGADNKSSKLSLGRRRLFLMGFKVLLYTGLRPTEFFWLRDSGKVTTTAIHIERTKTGIKRAVPLSDHISDFYDFHNSGLFDKAIYHGTFQGEKYKKYNAGKLHESMRRSFAHVREAAGITDRRKVLYSLKDTLVARMRATEGYTLPIEVAVTGHVNALAKGRHYGNVLGGDADMMRNVKALLDQITYN